jgi:hypothetical protein
MKATTFLVVLFLTTSICRSQDSLVFKDGKKFSVKPFLKECKSAALKSSPGVNAETYCKCMLQLVSKYFTSGEMTKMSMNPNSKDAKLQLIYKLQALAPEELKTCGMYAITKEKIDFDKTEQEIYLKGCANQVKKLGYTEYDENSYCKCFYDSIRGKFSSVEMVDQNNPKLKQIMHNCFEKSKKKTGKFVDDYIYNTYLYKICSEVNKNCPLYVDSTTMLLNSVYTAVDTTITYTYKLVDIEKSSLNLEKAKDIFSQYVIERANDNPSLKSFKEMKVHVTYSYYDKNSNYLFTISLPQ